MTSRFADEQTAQLVVAVVQVRAQGLCSATGFCHRGASRTWAAGTQWTADLLEAGEGEGWPHPGQRGGGGRWGADPEALLWSGSIRAGRQGCWSLCGLLPAVGAEGFEGMLKTWVAELVFGFQFLCFLP